MQGEYYDLYKQLSITQRLELCDLDLTVSQQIEWMKGQLNVE